MTEYRYKWVSVRLGGEPDTHAIEKAVRQGWEPVEVLPADTQPLGGLTMEQTLRGMALYRMPEALARERDEQRQQHNRIEQDPRTHVDRANAAIEQHIAALNKEHNRTDVGKGWSKIVGSGNVVVGSKPVWTPVERSWHSEES